MAAEAGAGTLFVIDGDLARLHCDAILIAVDIASSATDRWIEGSAPQGACWTAPNRRKEYPNGLACA